MISTADGEKWSDFELVTSGPVESDVAMAGPEGVAAYGEAAARLGLRPLDERLLRVTESAGLLAVVACLAMAPQLPMLVDGVKPVVDQWRAAPSIAEAVQEIRQRAGLETADRLVVEHLDHRKFGDTLPNEAAECSCATLGSTYHHVSLVGRRPITDPE
jgi:hypothetical protein